MVLEQGVGGWTSPARLPAPRGDAVPSAGLPDLLCLLSQQEEAETELIGAHYRRPSSDTTVRGNNTP